MDAQPLLEANLAALAEVQPDLHARLQEPFLAEHLRPGPDDLPALRHHRTLYPLTLPAEAIPAAFEGRKPGSVTLLRVGLGELVDAALQRLPEGAPPVRAWESDPALLRLALSMRDWAGPLREGRLRLYCDADLIDLAAEAEPETLLAHPVLAPFSTWAWKVLLDGVGARRAVLCDGGLMVGELSAALQEEGLQVYLFDPVRLGLMGMQRALSKVRPAVVAAVNHVVGLPELCGQLGLTLVEWEIDPTIERVLPPRASVHTTFLFTWRKRNVPVFRAAGFAHVHHLPLSADVSIRRPVELSERQQERLGAPVAFVGNSLVARAPQYIQRTEKLLAGYLESRGQPPSQAGPVVQAILHIQRQQLSRWMVPELLSARCPGLDVYLRREGIIETPDQLLGEVIGAEWRLNAVAACAPFGVHVWGDDGWRQLEPRGVKVRGPASNRDQLTRIYNAATINLDIGRAYQRDIVTLRVFDVLACGGFVLAEDSEELSEVFQPGVEIITWSRIRDLPDLVRHYLDHPEERKEIARRGHERVLKDHRLQDRVRQMLAVAGV